MTDFADGLVLSARIQNLTQQYLIVLWSSVNKALGIIFDNTLHSPNLALQHLQMPQQAPVHRVILEAHLMPPFSHAAQVKQGRCRA